MAERTPFGERITKAWCEIVEHLSTQRSLAGAQKYKVKPPVNESYKSACPTDSAAARQVVRHYSDPQLTELLVSLIGSGLVRKEEILARVSELGGFGAKVRCTRLLTTHCETGDEDKLWRVFSDGQYVLTGPADA